MHYEIKNPNYKAVIEDVLSRQFFMKHVGIEIAHIEPGKVLLKLPLQEQHLQQAFMVHGGVTATIADIAMGFSALTLADVGKGMVTADLHISYHRPAKGTTLFAEATVTKPGRLLNFCEALIWTEDEKGNTVEVAKAYSTMCTIDKE
mgnify:CR=1 FL=1